MFVLTGSDEASKEFAKSLARSLNEKLHVLVEKKFPDGEQYIRLPEIPKSEERVVFVQTFIPVQDTMIIKTLLTIDALREKGVKNIDLIVPYFAYSRQDREFLPNEAVSIRTVLKILKDMGASRLFTVEIHKKDSLRYFGDNAYSISPYEYMARNINLDKEAIVLAPDLGALDRAKILASSLGAEFDYLIKKRNRVTGEIRIEPKKINVKNKNVIIVDDIISTGGTIAKASKLLLSQGASNIKVIVAHALMINGALNKLKEAGVERVYACNTLYRIRDPLMEYIDVAPLVAEEIRKWP